MTEPTTEELVERLNYIAAVLQANAHKFAVPDHIPAKIESLRQVSQRLSDLERERDDLEGKLGEARRALEQISFGCVDDEPPFRGMGLNEMKNHARLALKLTASGGGEDNSLSSAAEHSGSSTPRTSAPSSTGGREA